MGYESLVHVYGMYGRGHHGPEEIAQFDLGKMGYETVNGRMFRDIFTEDADVRVRNFHSGWQGGFQEGIFEYNEEMARLDVDYCLQDMYGQAVKAASIDTVIKWLEASQVILEYDKARLFLKLLKTIKMAWWLEDKDVNDLIVVHYGY